MDKRTDKHAAAFRNRRTADEMARIASIGPRRDVTRKARAGKLPPSPVGNRLLRFPKQPVHQESEIAAAGSAQRSPSEAPAAAAVEAKAKAHPFIDFKRLLEIENELMRERLRILQGRSTLKADAHDKRFKHPVWQKNAYFRRVMQSYLAWKQAIEQSLDCVEVSDVARKRLRFVGMQIIEAGSPINFPLGNPAFVDRAIKTRGRSVLNGLRNFVDDLLHNGGMPRMVDSDAFQVGRNVACTPGAVVYRDEVFELLQYTPTTAMVQPIPLLIIPPQINKYYIVDLAPERSFIEYAVKQGLQVFCISWRNPTVKQRDWDLDTYALASKRAIAAARDITGADSVNLAGGCAGGTLAAALAGEMAANGEGGQLNSLTLLVTVLDASSEMPITLFATDAAVETAKAWVGKRGVLDGHQTRRAFAWLRPGDLVWSFVANNYLMGNPPPAFDVLYWNNDSTRLSAAFHRNLMDIFQRNPLAHPEEPNRMTLLNTPVDLGKVRCKSFVAAGITDHITPWTACYLNTRLLGGDTRFVLSSSGHIQSLVNPPGNPKSKYFMHNDYALTPGQWLECATEHKGSWWENWAEWACEQSGKPIPAPASLGSQRFPPIDAAPGMYVHCP